MDCLRRIGVRSKKDAAILSLVLVFCCAVTAILIASLQGLLNPPPWEPSLPSLISLASASVMITVTFMWIFLGACSLFYRPPAMPEREVESPMVSAIIPAHNEERVVADLVTDLLNQSYRRLEVIVVAHNCTDGTEEVLRGISDPRLKVYRLRTRESGKALALNYGVSMASGEIIAEFDADNRIKDPDMIRKALKYFEYLNADVVQARLETKNGDFNLLTKYQEFEYKVFSHLFWAGRNVLKLPCTLGGTGVFFRRSILEKVGFWDNELTEDYAMFCKLSHARAKILYAPDVVCYDEKPAYWSMLFRQRSRWVKGHMNLIPKWIFRWTGLLDLIYLLAPLANLAWYVSTSLILLHLLTGVSFWYPPVAVWFLGTLASILILYGILRKTGCSGMKRYIPLYYAFSFHWLVLFPLSFFVKSWGATKTAHGEGL
ncbi:glycosyltransferase [Thermofilum sp.]|uniref:glycosyltransferase family 2 protein n=1 Tax=Thermofilum sp. TaxID=1961369 RepID=UPI0031654C47